MSAWKMTVRHGSKVDRVGFEDLGSALSEARSRAEEIIGEGPVGGVRSIREYEASDRVAARIEVSGRGLLMPPTAGLDIRGDLSLVAFSGSMRRRTIATGGVSEVFDAIRKELE